MRIFSISRAKTLVVSLSLLFAAAAFAGDPASEPVPAVDEAFVRSPETQAVALGWSTKFVPLYVQTQSNENQIWVALDANYVLPTTFVNRDPVTGWSTCSTATSAARFLKAHTDHFPVGDGYFKEIKATLNGAAMTGSTVRVLLQDVCHNGYITFVGLIVDRPQ